MYLTTQNARNLLDLGLADVSIYPDALVGRLIAKATQLVNMAMNQSIEVSDTTERVLCIPQFDGSMLINLSRRFINSVQLPVTIHYSYNISDLVLNDTKSFFIEQNEGMIETIPNMGTLPQYLFNSPDRQKYYADVTYNAGFDFSGSGDTLNYGIFNPVTTPNEAPQAFLEAFYEVINTLKMKYDAEINQELTNQSAGNQILSYKSLNETVTYKDNNDNGDMVKSILTDSVNRILSKFRKSEVGIGINI
jgi:hypothetical protein